MSQSPQTEIINMYLSLCLQSSPVENVCNNPSPFPPQPSPLISHPVLPSFSQVCLAVIKPSDGEDFLIVSWFGIFLFVYLRGDLIYSETRLLKISTFVLN